MRYHPNMLYRHLVDLAVKVAATLAVLNFFTPGGYTEFMRQIHAPATIGLSPTLAVANIALVMVAVAWTWRVIRRIMHPAGLLNDAGDDIGLSFRNAIAREPTKWGHFAAWARPRMTTHRRYVKMAEAIKQLTSTYPTLGGILGEQATTALCRIAYAQGDLLHPDYERDALNYAAQLRPAMIFDARVILGTVYRGALQESLGCTVTQEGFVLRDEPTTAYQRVIDRLFIAAADVIQNSYYGNATAARKRLRAECRSASDAGFTTPCGSSTPKDIAAYAMTEASSIVSDVVATTPLAAVL